MSVFYHLSLYLIILCLIILQLIHNICNNIYYFMLNIQYRYFHKFLIFLSNTKSRWENNSRKKYQLFGSKRCTVVSTGSLFIPHESRELAVNHSTPKTGLLKQTGISPGCVGMGAACSIRPVFVGAHALCHLQQERQDRLWANSLDFPLARARCLRLSEGLNAADFG